MTGYLLAFIGMVMVSVGGYKIYKIRRHIKRIKRIREIML
jgi:hypothetical protein